MVSLLRWLMRLARVVVRCLQTLRPFSLCRSSRCHCPVVATYGLGTVLAAFCAMIALLVVTIMRITVEPVHQAEVIAV
jgi:hypothetical protein